MLETPFKIAKKTKKNKYISQKASINQKSHRFFIKKSTKYELIEQYYFMSEMNKKSWNRFDNLKFGLIAPSHAITPYFNNI